MTCFYTEGDKKLVMCFSINL